MTVTILTLFPDMFRGPFDDSILRRARENGILNLEIINIRDFANDAYKTVDGRPYGGGGGMILRIDVVDRALAYAVHRMKQTKPRIILLDPQGTPFTQKKAYELKKYEHMILICGHYEGFDERIRSLVHEEISIGDYILTGGELPSMVIIDCVARLLSGTLQSVQTVENESFSLVSHELHSQLLEYPQYTKPQEYNGMTVPLVLVSGDHKKIESWRLQESVRRTTSRRPDLFLQVKTAKKDLREPVKTLRKKTKRKTL